MKILPTWLREFVEIPVDDQRLADDLTNSGTAVEGLDTVNGITVYEVEFTANRVDAMNHYGVARECSAIYGSELKSLRSSAGGVGPKSGDANFTIEIEAPDLCARYTGQIVTGVAVGASPEPVTRRLALLESRTINNVTDASNYTLFEMGHPTHCFDLDKLEGGKIVVRRARPGEKLRTLDGVERVLHPDDLVIADAKKAVALAGVMGGFETMITESTRNVLIEGAWFDPIAIRKTARRHGMHTDASHRFERGADVETTSVACARVALRLLEWSGGMLQGSQIDVYPKPQLRTKVRLRRSQIARILGREIPQQDVTRILGGLGFELTPGRLAASVGTQGLASGPLGSGGAHAAVAEQVDDFAVKPPSWRLDVEREIDVIEELARLWGYDKLPSVLPPFSGAVEQLPDDRKEARLRSTLLALGYDETVSLAFASRADVLLFSGEVAVELANPVSEEAPLLRTSLLPGMLGMLAHNLNRGNRQVRLFEQGHIFERLGERVVESRSACFAATEDALRVSVPHPRYAGLKLTDSEDEERAVGFAVFRLFKGCVEALLSPFEREALYFDAHSADCFHPGRSSRAVLDGATVARFGQLHPRIAAERKLRQPVYLAEIDLERLYRHSLREPKYQEIPRYPSVERDFSFLFDQGITWERIDSTIRALNIAELQTLQPVEIFRGGEEIQPGKYSLLLRGSFQSPSRTLRDDEVALWSSQIVQALRAIGGTQRA